MRYIPAFITAFLWICFQGRYAHAEPQLEVLLSAREITLNETATLTIQAEWPETEGQYSFALPDLKLYNLSLDHQGESQETFLRNDQKWIRKTFSFFLKALQKGKGEVEPFLITYIDPDTQQGGRFTVSEQLITIKTANSKITLYLLAVGVIGLFIAGGIGFQILKARQSVEQIAPKTKEEEIVSQFKWIRESKKAQLEAIHDLGLLLQQFIVEHYKIAPSQARELIEALKQMNVPRSEIDQIKQLLDRFYEAKFTGLPQDKYDLEDLYRDSLRFMEGKQVVGNP